MSWNAKRGFASRDQAIIRSAMPHAWTEHEHLAKADIDIAAGEKRVAEQIALIAWMARKGQDTAEAEKLLRTLERTLETWRDHRRLILEAIARQEGPDRADPEA